MIPEHLEKLMKQGLKGKKATDGQQKKIYKKLEEAYNAAMITPGEAIGVITAESFGEPSTQMALDVFHFAGVAEMQVARGLPRIIEIFDGRKEPSTPQMELPVRPKYGRSIEMIRELALKVKESRFKDITLDVAVNVAKHQVEISLDKKEMRERGIKPKEVINMLEEGVIKGLKLKDPSDPIILKPLDKEITLSDLYMLKEKLKESFVRGLKGVTHLLPIKDDAGFTILTAGSNLKAALEMEELDRIKVRTNNLHETAAVLGIEAARQVIIDETLKVLKDQGLDIDIRHIMMVADLMTSKGEVKGITRSGITGQKESVLARASFETPIKHLVKASLTGEEDNLASVLENVIMNQPIPLGTGLPRLIAKPKEEENDNNK
jgi:DNA-directed RNA polymerase subunit A"